MRVFFTLDEASVRQYDKDGHLHIEVANISKACVNPYVGEEIPGWKELGLDPTKIYRLLRDPKELEKAAPTFRGKPVLIVHKPLNANDHPFSETVGSVGTEVEFQYPYLRAPLTIWPNKAIDLIKSGRQRELSCGYQYTPDMTPGEFEDESYDGVMRNIVGNHVAIVEEGRAGPDVVIGDSKEQLNMKKPLSRKAAMVQGAVMGFLMPRLAQDAKIDLTPAFIGITAKNFSAKKDTLLASVAKIVDGKLAQDANAEGLKALLEAMAPMEPEEGKDEPVPGATEENAAPPIGARKTNLPEEVDDPDDGADADPMEEFKQWLAAKLGPENYAECEKRLSAMKGGNEEPAAPAAPGAPGEDDDLEAGPGGAGPMDKKTAKDRRAKDENMVDQPAMDKALAAQADLITKKVREEARQLREAERAVEPYIGKIAMDSIETGAQVYRTALKMLGVKTADTVHESALPALLSLCPTREQKVRQSIGSIPAIAFDSAGGELDFDKIFSHAVN